MVTLARWYESEEISAALAAPDTDWLGAIAARNDQLFAERRRDEETHDLIVIDQQGVDDYLAYASDDYDLEQGA